MDGRQTPDAGVVDALDGADPQLEVRAHGILHQHGNVLPAQRVGDLLHGEGIGRRAGADPQQIDASVESRGDMLARGDLRGDVHARLALDALQPGNARGAHALEASRLGPGLPQPGAEDAESLGGKGPGRVECLFFGFGAARSCNDQRPPGIDPGQYDGLNVVHGYCRFFVVSVFGSRADHTAGVVQAAYWPRMRKSLVSGRTASIACRKRSGSSKATST